MFPLGVSWGFWGSWSTTELPPSEEPAESSLRDLAVFMSTMRLGFSHPAELPRSLTAAEHGDELRRFLDEFHQFPPQTPPWNSSSMILEKENSSSFPLCLLVFLRLFVGYILGNWAVIYIELGCMKVNFHGWCCIYICVQSYIHIFVNNKLWNKVKECGWHSQEMLIRKYNFNEFRDNWKVFLS